MRANANWHTTHTRVKAKEHQKNIKLNMNQRWTIKEKKIKFQPDRDFFIGYKGKNFLMLRIYINMFYKPSKKN